MSPRPTIVEKGHVTPSPTESDVTGGEVAVPLGLTPTPPDTPSPPSQPVVINDADPSVAPPPPVNNNRNNHHENYEEEPIIPALHPFMPYPPYRSDLEDSMPLNTNLPRVLKQVCATDNLSSVRQLRLRVISREMSLQRLCLHVPNLRELTLDGSCLISLRDLGCGLTNLHKLRVARCGLDSLDGLFGLMSLRELHAADNTIEDVGACSALQHIKRIDVSRNRVREVTHISFLRVCPALKHLTLAGCPVSDGPRYRLDVRRQLPQLATLDGQPFYRGGPVDQQDSDDDSDGDDENGDDGGNENVSPFSSASEDGGGEESDGDHPHPGSGDASSSPGPERRSARATLPAIQGTISKVPQLPPLRPLEPLPPIKSQARPASAAAMRRPISPIFQHVRPTTGLPGRKGYQSGVEIASSPLVEDASRSTISPRFPKATPATEIASGSQTSPDLTQVPQELPGKSAAVLASPKESKLDVETSAIRPGQSDKCEAVELTERVNYLLLDQDERIERWTDKILQDPALEQLEKFSALVADDLTCGDEKISGSNEEDDVTRVISSSSNVTSSLMPANVASPSSDKQHADSRGGD